MLYLDVFPVLAEIFCDEAAVAVVGLLFAAEEAGSIDELARGERFDGAGFHEGEEALLVGGPVAFQLLVVVQHVLGGGEVWGMDVIHVADGFCEKAQVVLLGESGELGDVVEADVDETPTRACWSVVKKVSADFLVKPMV